MRFEGREAARSQNSVFKKRVWGREKTNGAWEKKQRQRSCEEEWK